MGRMRFEEEGESNEFIGPSLALQGVDTNRLHGSEGLNIVTLQQPEKFVLL